MQNGLPITSEKEPISHGNGWGIPPGELNPTGESWHENAISPSFELEKLPGGQGNCDSDMPGMRKFPLLGSSHDD